MLVRPARAFVALAFLTAIDAQAQALTDELAGLLKSRFPSEQFVPVPSGSESRWAPKSIWCYLDNVKKRADGAGMTKAWVRFSSGQLLYPDQLAPVQRERVVIGKREDSVEKRLALAASLAGVLSAVQVDAGVSAEITNKIEFSVDVPSAEIHWVDLADLRIARELISGSAAAKFNAQRNAGGGTPKTIVISAALWVSGGKVVAAQKAGVAGGLTARLSQVLTSLGLDVSKVTTARDEVTFPAGGYIAVSALEMNNDGYISKAAAGAAAFAPKAEDVATNSESRDRLR